jgi:hypothetical protein
VAQGKAVVRRHFCQAQGLRSPVLLAISVLVLCALSMAQQAQRIPRQQPRNAAVLGTIHDQYGNAVFGANVCVTEHANNKPYCTNSNGEGIFRLADLPAGEYQLVVDAEGVKTTSPQPLTLLTGQMQAVDIRIQVAHGPAVGVNSPSGLPGPPRAPAAPEVSSAGRYPGLRSPQPSEMAMVSPEVVPGDQENFSVEPYRWTVEMPAWQRYKDPGDYPYVQGHWYDPFNRNRWKGDYPILGQDWFFKFTGTSLTGIDLRRLPVPSGLGSERPNSQQFFGHDEEFALSQTFLFSFNLFRGDTTFKPIDYQFVFTPAVNLNYLQTQERGLVNVNVEAGTNRFDTHVGLQEGFFELKLRDLSPNFDFISIRAGIQEFNADFRGFMFVDEQPGVRVFGNLRSNRINYNLAYFYMLEKDTNSGLNTFQPRQQQVEVANVFVQDFLTKGYTTEFLFLGNQDHPSIHFDTNGFLVRPAPIGNVVIQNGVPIPHGINAYYLGWTGNGHIKRLNISNAFYQALGNDSFNTIAGRPVNINAQFGALELSIDKDWLRFRGAVIYSSGDSGNKIGKSRTSTATGFDSIVDNQHFAGTSFSFFDREGIPLSSTGVALVTPFSFIPDLRSSKEEGQANFVNPGLRLYNVGIDADLTPKLRGFLNTSYLQFDHVQPLQLVLFQPTIHRAIGWDFGAGVNYRPPLSENIVLTTGVSALVPSQGYIDVYNGHTLLSGFAGLRLQF